ncbi:hypothetical protein KXV85_006125, partial [Aspergillus fumigatus]
SPRRQPPAGRCPPEPAECSATVDGLSSHAVQSVTSASEVRCCWPTCRDSPQPAPGWAAAVAAAPRIYGSA